MGGVSVASARRVDAVAHVKAAPFERDDQIRDYDLQIAKRDPGEILDRIETVNERKTA